MFKGATTAALRAIANHPEATVVYAGLSGNQKPSASQAGEVRLPTVPHELTRENVAHLRGTADAMAMRLKHHDAGVHARHLPSGEAAIEAYNAMEQARVEALGAEQYAGVRKNLGTYLEQRLSLKGYQLTPALFQMQMSDALQVMILDRLAHLELGTTGAHVRSLFRGKFGDKLDAHFDALAETMHDQDRSAEVLRDLIKALALEEGAAEREQGAGKDKREGVERNSELHAGVSQDNEGSDKKGARIETQLHAITFEGDEEPRRENEAIGDALEPNTDGRRRSLCGKRLQEEVRYKVFTKRFDQIEDASNLCDAEELARLRVQLDHRLMHLQGVVSRLANRLQRRLMAQQIRAWEFDHEEGLLDAARLARVVVNPMHALSFKREKEIRFPDTVVTLLIDNSSSMHGRPITVAAMTADLLAQTLERCGVKVEILGFTTSQWHGGESRKLWAKSGKPANPGRLNDLRHIIYKSADMPWRRARKNLGLMLREGILRENIDGEALAWAYNRIAGRPEVRRILMVISDGAPVDESTLSVHAGNYLEQHLRDVIAYIQTNTAVQLLAIGIGHDVTRYYRRAVTLMDADKLGGAVMDQLTDLFEQEVEHARGIAAPLVM